MKVLRVKGYEIRVTDSIAVIARKNDEAIQELIMNYELFLSVLCVSSVKLSVTPNFETK